jgi:hypothetical protein
MRYTTAEAEGRAMNAGRGSARHVIRIALACGVLASCLLPDLADAVVLRSGQIFVVGTGTAVFCFVSNVASKPVTVLATRFIDEDGATVATTNRCLPPALPALQPGASCEFESSGASSPLPIRVEVEVKGSAKRVRARCVAVANGVVSDSVELR